MVFIWRRVSKLCMVAMVACTLLALAACASGAVGSTTASPTPTALPRPTQATIAAGTLLYHADWSQNLAGWQGASARGGVGAWQVHAGNLQIDAKGDQIITAPYQPTVQNYAIEVRVRIRSVTQDDGGFLIGAQKGAGKNGYQAEVIGLRKPGTHAYAIHPQCEVTIDPIDAMDSAMLTHDYEPGYVWHTYRLEIRGAQVVLFVDDQLSSHATSSQTRQLSRGPIQILDTNTSIEVNNFRVTAL